MKFDFLIVGAMKGGTSTLAHALSYHKDIFIPKNEIFYFSNNKNFQKGTKWYHKHLKKASAHQLAGEKTATYHYDLKSAERIKKYNPEVKLIWILREPVSRSYSQYWHVVKQGGDYRSFEKAVEDELNSNTKNIWHKYISRSYYDEQLAWYLKYFQKSQMHFLLFEDLIRNKDAELEKVLNFLGLDMYDGFSFPAEKKNVTYLSRFPMLLFNLRKIFGKSFVFKVLRKLIENNKPGYPKISAEQREMLKSHFREHNERLGSLIERDLSSWN